jgi:predicted transcriptional regulator
MVTITTVDVRGRREALGVSQVQLALRSGVSLTWLRAIEAGLQPTGSRALARVETALDRLEHEHGDGEAT